MMALKEIRQARHDPLRDLCAKIQHPIEVVREYEDEGLLTVMAKNVRSNRAEMSDPRFMPSQLRSVVARNKLNRNDVLVTRTGANFGQAAPWKQDFEAFACADILVLREPSIPAGYLSSFLESAKGKPLVLRGGYGAGQPHIAPPYLADMLIPRFGALEGRIDAVIDRSVQMEIEAASTVQAAEEVLLAALGLANWTPPEPLAYSARASDVFASGRFDAQYFMPAKEQVRLSLAALPGQLLSDRVDSIRDQWIPDRAPPTMRVRNYDLTDALVPLLDAEQEPSFAADIGSMSMQDLMRQIEAAPVTRCDEVAWRFLGLSMAVWNALISAGLTVLWLVAARRTAPVRY